MFLNLHRYSVSAFLLQIEMCLLGPQLTCSHVCSNVALCDTYFQSFADLQLTGCGPTNVQGRTTLTCAGSCFANQSCTAFISNGTVCKTCPGGLVSALNFATGQNTFLQRTAKVTNLIYLVSYGDVYMVLQIPGGISSGRVGYLHATLMAQDSFNIDFGQDPAVTTSNFHFKAWWNSNSDRRLVLNHCNNGTWGSPEVFPPFPFPFTVNKPLTLHVLVTAKSYDLYINGAYCCYYNHTLPVANVRYMRVSGKLNVHEMSV